MKHGCQHNAGGRDENDAGEKCITGGKYLGGIGVQILHGPHTGEDHGGVQEGIDPTETCDQMVANDTDQERKPDHSASKKESTQYAMIKSLFEVGWNWVW